MTSQTLRAWLASHPDEHGVVLTPPPCSLCDAPMRGDNGFGDALLHLRLEHGMGLIIEMPVESLIV